MSYFDFSLSSPRGMGSRVWGLEGEELELKMCQQFIYPSIFLSSCHGHVEAEFSYL